MNDHMNLARDALRKLPAHAPEGSKAWEDSMRAVQEALRLAWQYGAEHVCAHIGYTEAYRDRLHKANPWRGTPATDEQKPAAVAQLEERKP